MGTLDGAEIRAAFDTIQPDRSSVDLSLDLSADINVPDPLECSTLYRCIPQKRVACLGRWRDRLVFAKIFLDRRRAGIHAAREQRGCELLKVARVASPTLLFHTKIEAAEIQVLLFEHVPNGTNGETLWNAAPHTNKKLILLQLVSLIAGHHKAGIVQRDLHLDNFLFAYDTIYTLDAADIVGKRQTPTSKKGLDNLALLLAQLQPEYDAWLDDAFTEYYKTRGTEAGPGDRALLQKALLRWRRHRKSVMLEKVFRSCTDYVCSKSWHRFAMIDRKYDTPGLRGLISNPDTGMENGKFLKLGNTSTVARVKVDGRDLIVKRYNLKNWRHALNRAFRPSRAAVSWLNAHRLHFYGVESPKPVALVENRWGPLRRKAYFITEYCHGMNCLEYFETHNTNQDPIRQTAKNTIAALKQLEACKISHGDMKGTNILVDNDKIMLIDLDAMREHQCEYLARRHIARDHRRFMRNWCGNVKLHALFAEYLEISQGSEA